MRIALLTAVALVAAVMLPASAAKAAPADERLAEVERYLREHHAEIRAPGFAYAIVRGDRVVARAAWGVDGDGQPVTGQTPFVLGSVSKSFTALAVMQLVEAGRVDLDAPVLGYLPWFRLADESASRRVTVRQLLTHSSGIPGVATRGMTDRYDNTAGGLTRLVRALATVEPTQPPGRSYQYSDANYIVAGALVEAVTGQSFGAYLRAHVLDPLGMRGAATAAEADALGGVPAGFRYYFGRPRHFDRPFDTSGVSYGFLAASLDDMTHYAIAHLRGGEYGGRRVLSPQGIERSHAGQVATGARGAYGFGWRDSALDGTGARIVWHAGAVANSFSHILLVPEEGLAVIVLANIYGIAMDGPLTTAAFNTARILHGGQAVAVAEDPFFVWARRGLLVTVALLAVVLAWSVLRAVRRPRPRPSSGCHVVAVTAAWVAGCAALTAAAGWALPASWDGAGLPQALLFAPDIGHTIIAVIVLAAATALARVAAALRILAGPG
ncbi:serine hydrolase domain-containing protein [Phytohabitans kaempferiae]|uniref:Serine hydrolase domain-containing protein n=1 Tax=Phytohabitans kaempferiae TaxID=1620943 RepID=A0ABV6MBU2_9ACTN